jgi:nickel/cobalt transporter (NiCoT) family protein
VGRVATPRRQRLKRALTPAERRRAAGLAAVVVGLHAVGFALLFGVVSAGVLSVGLGVTAYTLGVRHAFDADHLAAIDNTTRKLMSEGQRPLSVGFFFSLGHSTIVLALGLLVVAGVRSVGDSAALRQAGLIGPIVSGTFLVAIGLLNVSLLVGAARVLRRGDFDAAGAAPGGVMTRVYGRAARAVRKPWHMYPLGCLFGLGFDTATEVALLVLAGAGAASGLPFYAILCLPILFAAGMSLFDTLDGAFMNFAYGWALSNPVRKAFYNLAITGLSVAVALGIGGIQLLAVLADKLSLSGGVWDFVSGVDLNLAGYAIVAVFALTWAVAVAVWRLARLEERWS